MPASDRAWPIWQATQEDDLAVVHHSSTWDPPYFPRSQDMWDNVFLERMNERAGYVGGTARLKHRPSEYLTSGRFFSSIERHEGEDMFNMVSQFLGDDVLMYASDYPHSECQLPNSVDNVLRWLSLKPDTKRKLLWDNASRFYKRT